MKTKRKKLLPPEPDDFVVPPGLNGGAHVEAAALTPTNGVPEPVERGPTAAEIQQAELAASIVAWQRTDGAARAVVVLALRLRGAAASTPDGDAGPYELAATLLRELAQLAPH